jgi:hypothetical protein
LNVIQAYVVPGAAPAVFTASIENAASAGAIGVIVYDVIDEGLLEMAGSPVTTIPAVFVQKSTGALLQAAINSNPALQVTVHQ